VRLSDPSALCLWVYILVALEDRLSCGILVSLGPPPRWLGGSRGVVARVVLVLGHLLMICEGCCAFPGGAPKATLVNCSCHWATSFAVGSCGALGELGFGLPISHWTTRCRSTQRGLACRQAREPWEKNLVFILCMIGFVPVIGHHILWLVHPLRGGMKIISSPFTFPQTTCNKLFSVISCESLFLSLLV
jgi:hypothetical protein